MGDSIFYNISNSVTYSPMLSIENPFFNEVSLNDNSSPDNSFNGLSEDEDNNTYTFIPFTSYNIYKTKLKRSYSKSNMIKFRYNDKGRKVKMLKI